MIEKRRYVTSAPDRHGAIIRHRFRFAGVSRYLPGNPGEDAFESAYQEALGEAQKALKHGPVRRPTPEEERFPGGSIAALIRDYRMTGRYAQKADRTREQYEETFNTFGQKLGAVQVAKLTTKDVMKMMNDMKATPGKANVFLRILKLLLNYSIARGDIVSNPTNRVQPYKLGEWATWTDEDIAQFEARWPLGTMERRAFNVALATGQRASDLAAMRRGDIRDGTITVTQSKTGETVVLPVIDALAADLAAFPPKGEFLVHRRDGKGYTRSAITHMIKDAMRAVKADPEGDEEEGKQLLPDDLNLHGLRKAMCRRLAEAGASEREIMSVSGHKSPQMVSAYVKKANQKTMAVNAIAKLSNRRHVQPTLSNPSPVMSNLSDEAA